MLPSKSFLRGAGFDGLGLRGLMLMSVCGISACIAPPTADVTRVASDPETIAFGPTAGSTPQGDGSALCCGPLTPNALRILKVLADSGLERLWANGRHVDWETGIPDEPVGYTGPNKSTHCSCFVPVMAKRLGIYLLRPPEHSQQLLANAQVTWLNGAEARQMGWLRVWGREAAQRMANQGAFVIAAVQNPDAQMPGHIAVVRPEPRTKAQLDTDGLMVAHAGFQNNLRVTEKMAFSSPPEAWSNIRYFAHPVP